MSTQAILPEGGERLETSGGTAVPSAADQGVDLQANDVPPAVSEETSKYERKLENEGTFEDPKDAGDWEGGFGGQEELRDKYATTSGEH